LPSAVPAGSYHDCPLISPGRIVRVTVFLAVLLLVVCLVTLSTGAGAISFTPLAKLLLAICSGSGAGLDPTEETILFSIRLPRILLAGIVGAALSSSGVIFQALLRNPLADPYILGISGGAALGAVIGIIIGATVIPLGIPGLAFLGALITIILVFGVSGSKGDRSNNTLLLTGVITNAFFSALIMFLVSISSSDRLHSVLFWLMGDLSLAEGYEIIMTGIVMLAGCLIMFIHAKPLNLLIMGEETAMQLGVDAKKTKKILLVTASLVTAVAVSVSGTIGFIGLIIPHLLRLILGSDHRLLLPASILFGASFLIVTDTIARTIMAPVELPVGVVTALCGAPYFIYLLHRREA
jgi:iron complex transport system permease protein